MTKPLSLRVAFQMDPLSSLHPERDTTVLLMKEALRRNYQVYSYEPCQLFFEEGAVKATLSSIIEDTTCAVGLKQIPQQLYELESMDVIWVRQDPPFDMSYLTTTYLLEHLKHPKIVNDPGGIRSGPEKLLPLYFQQWMPATLITQSIEKARLFYENHGPVIIKPLYEYSGRYVYKAETLQEMQEVFYKETTRTPNLSLIIQKFLPAIHQGDKRVFMIDGKVVGCFRRIPPKESYLSNFSRGGTAVADHLTAKEYRLCEELSPLLQKMGLFFVGLDIIDGHLIEINVTSPTGVPMYNHLYSTSLEKMLWDALVIKYLT